VALDHALDSSGHRKIPICAKHRALVEAGAIWDMDGHTVLMGQDVAPVLEYWSARPGTGSEGFTLILDLAGRTERIQVFLQPAEARALATFINAANEFN
jgi:hypothetical protein